MADIRITGSQHDRDKGITVKPAPTTEAEFYEIINNSDWPTLREYGFGKWDTVNNLISEAKDEPESNMIVVPVYEGLNNVVDALVEDKLPESAGSVLLDLTTPKPESLEKVDDNEWVVLFPAEWYSIIPNGFECTGLWGDKVVFESGKTDNDRRFGCLSFGFRKTIPAT